MKGNDCTSLSADSEESRLLTVLTTCNEKLDAAIRELFPFTLSRPMTDYLKLANNLEMARDECGKATAALKTYRRRRDEKNKAAMDSFLGGHIDA